MINIESKHTEVDSQVDWSLMDPLVHGDGQPGGLIEVGVDVSQVGGVVVLNMRRLNCHTVGRGGGGTYLVRQS